VATGGVNVSLAEHSPASATAVIAAGQRMAETSPDPWRWTTAGDDEASVLMATVPSKVAATAGVKVMQTTRLPPGARVPGSPPEMIVKPATDAQSTYTGLILLEQLMMPMLLITNGAVPVLVIVKQSGPADLPTQRSAKLMSLLLRVTWPA
jgi:hypothetical protein